MNYHEVMAQYHAGQRVPELEQRIAELELRNSKLEAENAEMRRAYDDLEKKWDFEVSDRIAMKVDRDRVKEALDEECQLTAKLRAHCARLREKVEIYRESRVASEVLHKVFVEEPLCRAPVQPISVSDFPGDEDIVLLMWKRPATEEWEFHRYPCTGKFVRECADVLGFGMAPTHYLLLRKGE